MALSLHSLVFAEVGRDGDKVLNAELGYPPSPSVECSYNEDGFAQSHLSKVPRAGVHPRILFSPKDIPNIVAHFEHAELGKIAVLRLHERLDKGFNNSESWTFQSIQALVDGDFIRYEELQSKALKKPEGRDGYRTSAPLYDCQLAALDALFYDKKEQGERAAKAIAAWAQQLKPQVEEWRQSQYGDNASRWGSWHHCGSLGLFGWEQLGLAYDFAYPFMTKGDRTSTRAVIASITSDTYVFGMNLPHHLRAWNWIQVGQCFGLLSLSIEGENGYEPRIYQRSVEMFQDYLTYNYSAKGSSSEAAGYTSFGWLWGAPAIVAMARRGDNLMTMDRYRNIRDWHFNISYPNGKGYLSHGDGGDSGPGVTEMLVMKHFYPNDSIVDYNYSIVVKPLLEKKDTKEDLNLISLLLWAEDVDAEVNPLYASSSDYPLTWYDAERGNMITRNEWSEDAFVLNTECRPDSYYSGHEHADRGNFNIIAHGVSWAVESFRSVESRFHNVVTIDGRGQGYFPPPGKVRDYVDNAAGSFISFNTKYAYDWFWPKAINGEPVDGEKFKSERFAHFKVGAEDFQKNYVFEKDQHPNVVKKFKGYDLDDSGMWDEDPWTIRAQFNPVNYAFRTIGMVKGEHPFVLVIDDIQKDDAEHLYEWNLMLNMDVELMKIDVADAPHAIGPRKTEIPKYYHTDITLCQSGTKRSRNRYYPKKGDPLLLVRVLDCADPADALAYDAKPRPYVSTFEKKDVREAPGGRTFGLDRKLVVPSRSNDPHFKVMIYPYRYGIDPLPETHFDGDTGKLSVTVGEQKHDVIFQKTEEGYQELRIFSKGEQLLMNIQ